MNLSELQAELRHFAAERHWQAVHTPKNLATALVVEAAELAEVFQWLTPEQSQAAHTDPALKQRIGHEVADVLLYLLQLADHSQIDLAQAVADKLALNARKHPARRRVARLAPAPAAAGRTHVLLDFENVQPSDAELQARVPAGAQLWVFHGPHQQRQAAQRYMSFGQAVTVVPISRPGKNALDFHLAFYMGYIASRNPDADILVVANDKGYGPMLAHAKAMGFSVQQLGHARSARAAAPASPGRPAGAARPTRQAKPVQPAPAITAVTAAAGPPRAAKPPAKPAARKAAAKKSAPNRPVAKKAAGQTGARTAPAKVAAKAAPKASAAPRARPPAGAPAKKARGRGASAQDKAKDKAAQPAPGHSAAPDASRSGSSASTPPPAAAAKARSPAGR